jgi:hypothetical protein
MKRAVLIDIDIEKYEVTIRATKDVPMRIRNLLLDTLLNRIHALACPPARQYACWDAVLTSMSRYGDIKFAKKGKMIEVVFIMQGKAFNEMTKP